MLLSHTCLREQGLCCSRRPLLFSLIILPTSAICFRLPCGYCPLGTCVTCPVLSSGQSRRMLLGGLQRHCSHCAVVPWVTCVWEVFFPISFGLEGSYWCCRRVPHSVGSGWCQRGSLDAMGRAAGTSGLFGLRVRYGRYQSRSVIICDLISSTLQKVTETCQGGFTFRLARPMGLIFCCFTLLASVYTCVKCKWKFWIKASSHSALA